MRRQKCVYMNVFVSLMSLRLCAWMFESCVDDLIMCVCAHVCMLCDGTNDNRVQ